MNRSSRFPMLEIPPCCSSRRQAPTRGCLVAHVGKVCFYYFPTVTPKKKSALVFMNPWDFPNYDQKREPIPRFNLHLSHGRSRGIMVRGWCFSQSSQRQSFEQYSCHFLLGVNSVSQYRHRMLGRGSRFRLELFIQSVAHHFYALPNHNLWCCMVQGIFHTPS